MEQRQEEQSPGYSNDRINELPTSPTQEISEAMTESTLFLNKHASIGRISRDGFFSDSDINASSSNINHRRTSIDEKESFKVEYRKTESEKIVEISSKATKKVEYTFTRPSPMPKAGAISKETDIITNVKHFGESIGKINGTTIFNEFSGIDNKIIDQVVKPIHSFKYFDLTLQADKDGKMLYFWRHNQQTGALLQSNSVAKIDGLKYYVIVLKDESQRLVAKLYIPERFDWHHLKVGQTRHMAFIDTFLSSNVKGDAKIRHTIFFSIISILLFWECHLFEMKHDVDCYKTAAKRMSNPISTVNEAPSSRRWSMSGSTKAKMNSIAMFMALSKKPE